MANLIDQMEQQHRREQAELAVTILAMKEALKAKKKRLHEVTCIVNTCAKLREANAQDTKEPGN